MVKRSKDTIIAARSVHTPDNWPRDMSYDESAAYDFATELLNRQSVSDVTYERSLLRWGEHGVVELTTLIGYFACVCWVMNVARTPAPASPDVRPLYPFPA